jgi:fructose/tagatose bisphosphate aldolase
VAKVNVNAEIRNAYLQALTNFNDTSDNLTAITRKAIDAADAVVPDKLRFFSRHDNESGQS